MSKSKWTPYNAFKKERLYKGIEGTYEDDPVSKTFWYTKYLMDDGTVGGLLAIHGNLTGSYEKTSLRILTRYVNDPDKPVTAIESCHPRLHWLLERSPLVRSLMVDIHYQEELLLVRSTWASEQSKEKAKATGLSESRAEHDSAIITVKRG